jgi:Alpha/beta-hydrolase family
MDQRPGEREHHPGGLLPHRFRREFRPAFRAWRATKPFENLDAAPTPFAIPQYRLAATADAERLDQAAEASSASVATNNQRATNYVLGVVLFAVALFFAGISTKLRSPEQMRWIPLVTFVQTAMDAANAMVSVPGEFGSFGHDYRADMVRFVHDAYGLPEASDAQLDRIDQQLRSLELERAQRIKAQHAHAAPDRLRTGPPMWTHLPAYRSAPDALVEPGGFEDDDKTIRHPPPPGENGSLSVRRCMPPCHNGRVRTRSVWDADAGLDAAGDHSAAARRGRLCVPFSLVARLRSAADRAAARLAVPGLRDGTGRDLLRRLLLAARPAHRRGLTVLIFAVGVSRTPSAPPYPPILDAPAKRMAALSRSTLDPKSTGGATGWPTGSGRLGGRRPKTRRTPWLVPTQASPKSARMLHGH